MSFSKIVALDIDGVLNPWQLGRPDHTGVVTEADFEFNRQYINGYYLQVYSGYGDLFRQLRDEHNVTVVWATTWITSPEGLDEASQAYGLAWVEHKIDYNPFGTFSGIDIAPGECGKQAALEEWMAENADPYADLVWIDDDIGDIDIEWGDDRAGSTLCIVPNDSVGLTRADFSSMIDFFTD